MRRWDEWLDLVGKGDEQAARAILESPPHGQFGQLPERASPTPSLPDYNYWDDVWKNDEGVWLTSFPPPAGYAGYERGTYDCMQYYERHCTPEEVAALVAHFDAQEAEDRAYHERDRDIFFAALGRRSAS